MRLHNSTTLHASTDPYDRVMGNVHFVNGLMDRGFRPDEVPDAAWQSYYADYFQSEIDNGGLSQFVYNSRWQPATVGWVRSGLTALGATAHAAVFAELERLVAELGPGLQSFLAGGYFGDNQPIRDRLNHLGERADTLRADDLAARNHAFLGRADTVLVPPKGWDAALDALAAALPDHAERMAALRAAQEAARSPEERAIRAACAGLGGEFGQLTAMNPIEVDGRPALAWHFLLADRTHFSATFIGGAMTIRNDDDQIVATHPFASATDESIDDALSDDELLDQPGDGVLFERAPGAVRPGPYCDETSTEITAPVLLSQMVAWLQGCLGTLTLVSDDQMQDYRAPTESGWTIVHLMGSDDEPGIYVGLEDTPGRWPSSRAFAQAVADQFRVEVEMFGDEDEPVVKPR